MATNYIYKQEDPNTGEKEGRVGMITIFNEEEMHRVPEGAVEVGDVPGRLPTGHLTSPRSTSPLPSLLNQLTAAFPELESNMNNYLKALNSPMARMAIRRSSAAPRRGPYSGGGPTQQKEEG